MSGGNNLFGSQYHHNSYRSRHSFPRRSPLPHFRSFKAAFLEHEGQSGHRPFMELSPKDSARQLTLFDNVQHRMAMEKVQDAVEEIRGRFGKSAISYACLMGDLNAHRRKIKSSRG